MAIWKVSTYYKKSCEEHEYYYKDGQSIVRKTGYRWSSFQVETDDDNPPEFEFDYVPGGDGKLDSINMYDCCTNNIINSELDHMSDGCWEDFDFPEDMDEDEQEALLERFGESSVYEVLEEEEGWSQNDTEAWVWGPILIEDEHGNQVKIICADDQGRTIEFKEDHDEEISFDELAEINPDNEQPVFTSTAAWPFPNTVDKESK